MKCWDNCVSLCFGMVSSAAFNEMCDRPHACPRPVSRFWVGDGDVFSVWLAELPHLENETNRGQGTQLFSHTGPKKTLKIDFCSKH